MNIRTLQIADIELPPTLERLRDLAYDLWWSWSPAATRLFAWIDPEHWRRYHNPVQLLINVEPHHWMRLLSDPEFRRAYDHVDPGPRRLPRAPALVRQQGLQPARAGRLLLDGVRDPRVAAASTRAASACSPATTARRPATWACPWWAWACSTARATSARPSTPTASSSTSTPNYDFARLPILPVQAPGRRRAHRAHRPARPRGAGRGLEGAGRPGAGAHARHRHPPERPRRPADHRRSSTCAAARCASARRSCSGWAACAPCARSASTPRSGT